MKLSQGREGQGHWSVYFAEFYIHALTFVGLNIFETYILNGFLKLSNRKFESYKDESFVIVNVILFYHPLSCPLIFIPRISIVKKNSIIEHIFVFKRSCFVDPACNSSVPGY